LIISGVGKIRAAAAVSYLSTFIGSDRPSIWLNIGIGGMGDVATGTSFMANKITDRSSGKSSYPAIVFDVPCETAKVMTVDWPDSNHQKDVVFDMEASGFFQSAILFSNVEFVHAYKVISDFDAASIREVTKQFVSRLIEEKIPEIEVIMKGLSALVDDANTTEEVYEKIVNYWRFSTTERIQLKKALDRWVACSGGQLLEFDQLSHATSAGDVIKSINKLIQSTPLTYP
ncbi:MAG: hypothetical protein AAGG81_09315, partial [Chlamydiota bacterium]